MEDSKYKDFLEQRHPELLKEAEDFFDVSERGSWEYVCKIFPKFADLQHKQIPAETMNRDFGWEVYREVPVGKTTAKVGIRLWVHAHKFVGEHWTKTKMKDDEHHIDFYLFFHSAKHGSCTCYQMMTNLPGMSCSNGNGETFPVDIPTKRDEIYQYLGL